MADQKATQLTSSDAVSDSDLLYFVDDPGGTPLSKARSILNVLLDITSAASAGDIIYYDGSGMAVSTPVNAGDLFYFDGSDIVVLSAGTGAQLLQMNAGATAPEWTSSPTLNIGFLNFGTYEEVTISSGAITITQSNVIVTAETTAADDLDTISGTSTGDIVILTRGGSYQVTVKDGTGNLSIEGDFVMDSQQDYIMLMNRTGATLYELSRSNNS